MNYKQQTINKTCFVIIGPTAVGKTAVAHEIAKKLDAHIISADSRQCFRELNIGVSKPSGLQLKERNYYFINSHSIQQELNAAYFEHYSLNAAAEIFQHHDIAVLVGGTGLYVNAFCNGMDEVPVIKPGIRATIVASYKEQGIEWLQQQVRVNDPDYFKDGEIFNPHRLMRTLEVKLSTGRSLRSFQISLKKQRSFAIVKIGLELDKQVLHQQINQRVDEMVENGLEAEVRQLLPYEHLNALNTVGYKELFSYHRGEISLAEAIELIKKNTRQYAKRQLTWFKKDERVRWTHPDNCMAIFDEILTK